MKHPATTALALAAVFLAAAAPQNAAAAHQTRHCIKPHTSTPITPLTCTTRASFVAIATPRNAATADPTGE